MPGRLPPAAAGGESTAPGVLLRLRDWRLYFPNPSFGNPPWTDAPFRVLILRLSPFADVERSTPHLFLAAESRTALPDCFVDMAFLPRPAEATLLTEAGLPLILGTQSRRPLGDFDLVLVSNSWLLEQVNLPFLLSRSGVPVWSGTRGATWPSIVLGGSNASASHALVTPAGDCVADAIFFGEGEGAVRSIVGRCFQLRDLPRGQRLRRIASEVPGLWVAGALPPGARRARAKVLSAGATPGAPVLPGPEASTARLSITAGCPCRCAFCFEGHDRAPFRTVPLEDLRRQARELKARTGASTLEVESFTFTAHPDLALLLQELHRLFLRVNLMSQRLDTLARTPGLLDLQIAADKRSYTLGVEGISPRLRTVLQKGVSEEDLRRAMQLIHEQRTRELKLFYILTGRETDADFEELAAFLKWLKNIRRRFPAAPRLVLSFGLLVRMPFTPLRHDSAPLDWPAWRRLCGRARSICETNGFEYRLSSSWPEFLASQSLARGGYRAHELLERLAAVGSISAEGLSAPARREVEAWLEAHRADVEPGAARAQELPFGTLEEDTRRDALYRQYEAARDGRAAPSPAARAAVDRGAVESLRQLVTRKHRLTPVFIPASLPREAAGMGGPWIDAWLLRDFLGRYPEQVENVLSMTEARVSRSGVLGEECAWHGKTVAAVIAWDPGALPRGTTSGDGAGEASGQIELRVALPVGAARNPAQSLAEYLRDAHAPVTVVRSADGVRFTVPDKSLRKKMLLDGFGQETENGWVLELRVGQRPFVADWLERLGGRELVRGADVEITGPGE